MRLRLFSAAIALPFLVSTAGAQLEPQLGGLSRTSSSLRLTGLDCSQLPNSCVSSLPSPGPAWAGGTGYDARSGQFWVSEGASLARIAPRNCAINCGPHPAPTVNAVVTGLEVLELTDELLVIDSGGILTTLSLSNSCLSLQVVGSCATGLAQQNQQVTSGLAADEPKGLLFIGYTDFAARTNQIVVSQLATPCAPLVTLPLPALSVTPFGSLRGLAVLPCRSTLFATDGVRILSVQYTYDPTGPAFSFGAVTSCTIPSGHLDPLVGLALRPNPGVSVGQGCSNGACRNCLMRHDLLTGPVLGNPNLVFRLEGGQDNTWTWLGFGFGHCNNTGPVIRPLCGPLLLGGASAVTQPLVAGPFAVSGGPGLCTGAATVVVNFPYVPAFCGSEWSTQFVSLCVGSSGTAPFGTAMSNCMSWTVIGP